MRNILNRQCPLSPVGPQWVALVTRQARSLPDTPHISFVFRDHSKMTLKENICFLILSSAEPVYLQSSLYFFLRSTACLVTLVAEKMPGDKSSNRVHETGFSATGRSLTCQLVTCHTSPFFKQAPGVPLVVVCLRGLSPFVLLPKTDLLCQPVTIGKYVALVQ
jgi:hypothetical protein